MDEFRTHRDDAADQTGAFPGGTPEAFEETASVLRGVFWSAEIDPATRTRHLHALRERAATAAGAGGTVGAPAPRRGRLVGVRRRIAATAGAATLLLGSGSGVAVAASSDALPGETLYPVKQLVENVRLALPGGSEAAVERRLALALTRLDEAAALAGQGADLALLDQTLTGTERWLREAGELSADDPALAALVDAAADRALARLTELHAGGLPDHASPAAHDALARAMERIREARGAEEDAPRTPAEGEEQGQGQGRGQGPVDHPGQATPGARENRPTGPPEGAPGQDGARGQGQGPPSEVGPPEGVPSQGSGASQGEAAGAQAQDPPADPPGGDGQGGGSPGTKPPDDAGSSEGAGAGAGEGPPENVGPPEDTGPPEGAGPPDGAGPP